MAATTPRVPTRPAWDFEAPPAPKVRWLAALRAVYGMRDGYDDACAAEFARALDGGNEARQFARFLGEPGAAALIATRPDLPALLDDPVRLGALPAGSLGRVFLERARADGIQVGTLAGNLEGAAHEHAADPDAEEDETFAWLRKRGVAAHDLVHTLTDYGRDVAGELAVLAFTLGFAPTLVIRVSLVLALLGAPKVRFLAIGRYVYRAWRRGCEANLPRSVDWETLLSLRIDEARARLGIAPSAVVHPRGLWRSGDAGWRLEPYPEAARGRV